uniref:Uncharacterized protein n=1 Tax=Ciona savignyi TaxID=51511 RepID=H2YST0_CIOSA
MEALQLSQIASQLLERDAKRANLPIQIFKDVTELLEHWNSDFDDLSQNENKLEELTLCFRVLRNSCVKCERNQNEIMKLTTVLTTLKVLQKICEDYSSKYHSALLCGCQFLGNLVAGNTTNQKTIWSLVFPTFLKVLCITDHFLPSGLFLSLVFGEGSLTCK